MLRGYQSLVSIVILMSLVFSFIVAGKGNIHAEPATAFTQPPITESKAEEMTRADYGKMPLIFEINKGQTNKKARFVSRGAGYTLYLTNEEAVFSLKVQSSELELSGRSDVLRMQFVGANANPVITGENEAITKTNYYTGKKRFENLPNYKRVDYKNLYEGIDAVFYGNENNQLEYDFTVAPNVDTNKIQLNFDGAKTLSIDASGSLVIKTKNTRLVQQKPFAYQEINGERKEIAASYRIEDPRTNSVSFSIGEYDRSQPLTIDPVLSYLTYIGGSSLEFVGAVAVDSAGNAYLSGGTFSDDFPASSTNPDSSAAFVAKLNSTGTAFSYVTILDGALEEAILGFSFEGNNITDLAIDAAGNAYVTGVTLSRDFPTTPGAYQTEKSIGCVPITVTCTTGAFSNEEVFVTKLDANGQISYSTYLGGRKGESGNGIAVDSAGRAYVTGATNSGLTFPTKNQYQGTGVFGLGTDGFLTVFTPDGSDIIYSTGLGGNSADVSFAVSLDSATNAYITGHTTSAGTFPTKNAIQATNGGGVDAFVAKFDTSLSGEDSLVYSTFLGGSGTERGFGIAVSAGGAAHVTGVTGSSNFPLKNAIDSQNQINEAFVTVYNSVGAQLHSTFLGGAGKEEGKNIALGNGGTIYVTGSTESDDFPLASPFQATRGSRDAFVTKLRLGGTSPGVSSSSFLGGSESDIGRDIAVRGAHIFVLGVTDSIDLTTTSGVVKPVPDDPDNGFMAKILDTRTDTIGTFNPANTVFNLKNTLAGGAPDITVDRGVAGDVAVAGDFNGDGIDTVSTFNNGVWKIFNFNVVTGYGVAPTTVNFGQAGDIPVVGDWNGDGIDTPGVYRPSIGDFFLTNSLVGTPNTDVTVNFGLAEDLPVAGDWNGDGIDSVGVFRPSAGQFFLTDDNTFKATIDIVAFFGTNGDLPVAGDWNGDGLDSIGVWRPSTLEFFLSNDNNAIANQFIFGASGDRPVVGDWDGKPNQ